MFEKLIQIDGSIAVGVRVVDQPRDEVGVHVDEVFGMRKGAKLNARQETVAINVGVAKLGHVLCREVAEEKERKVEKE